MSKQDELRDEVEALLRAARTLSPDTDSYLAETFVSRLDHRRTRTIQLRIPSLRLPRRLAALLAVATLAVGGPLAIHAYTTPSITSCVPTIWKTYPSRSMALADSAAMRTKGYSESGGEDYSNGHATKVYTLNGGCR